MHLADDLADIHQLNLSQLNPAFTEFAREVSVEKLDLAEAETSIKQFQKIKAMDNFNIAVPDLENLDSVTGTVMATAWVLALLIAIAIIKCCVSCCCPNIKCCGNVCKILWKSATTIFKCLKCIVCSCHESVEDKVANADTPLKEVRQSTPTHTNAPFALDSTFDVFAPQWEIVVHKDRALLMATLDSGEIFFNHLTGVIENEHGNELKLDIRPSANVLNQYLKVVHSLKPPKLIAKDTTVVLADDPEISFDERRRAYTHTLSNKRVYGYKLPVVEVDPSPPRLRADSQTDIIQ